MLIVLRAIFVLALGVVAITFIVGHQTESSGPLTIIQANVPLAAMFGYATELRSLTQGRASFTMRWSVCSAST